MIQTLLSIGVAQRMCFFSHNDLCSWNIILTYFTYEQAFDYLIDINQVYRVYSTAIPVILDFDKSHVVYDLQSFTPYLSFDSYHDALCLMINCVYNILKYQSLDENDKKKLLYIFKASVCDKVYCPKESIQNISDLRLFLEDAHKYAHITFSPKGRLNERTPMDMVHVLRQEYRPTYIGQTRILNTVERHEYVLYRNIGSPESIPHIPQISDEHVHPLLKLYLQQLFHRDTDEEEDRKECTLRDIHLPLISDSSQDGVYDFPPKYLDFLNIFVELLSSDGPYKLLPGERACLLQTTQNYLKDRMSIFAYSKHLINFKLQRNIL
jgi:hypothetical protein